MRGKCALKNTSQTSLSVGAREKYTLARDRSLGKTWANRPRLLHLLKHGPFSEAKEEMAQHSEGASSEIQTEV